MFQADWLSRLFQPDPSRTIPRARFWKVALRTIHLMATSVLVGGHVFGAPAKQLEPLLYVAIATGCGMILLEAYPTLNFIFEGWGMLLCGKLALLCVVPFAWTHRVPIIIAVVALASIGSHMPRRFRHYSFLFGRLMD